MPTILQITYSNGLDAPDTSTHFPTPAAAGEGNPPHCNWTLNRTFGPQVSDSSIFAASDAAQPERRKLTGIIGGPGVRHGRITHADRSPSTGAI